MAALRVRLQNLPRRAPLWLLQLTRASLLRCAPALRLAPPLRAFATPGPGAAAPGPAMSARNQHERR